MVKSGNISFNHSVPVGHLLSPGGGEIEVGLSARFHWSSLGGSENIVIQVEEMNDYWWLLD